VILGKDRQTNVFREVLTILLLTILFTFTSLGALLLRRGVRGGVGCMMYILWLAVMLTALLPLSVGQPLLNLVVSERTVTEVQPPYRDMHPEIMMIADASRPIGDTDFPGLRADLTASDSPVISDGGAVAFNLSGLMIAGVGLLFFVWAVGVSFCVVRELLEYREIRRFLQQNSDPCTDERILFLFNRCREQIGLRRHVTLRRIREDCPTTPCMIGFFRSTVYLSAFCDDMDAYHLANIFTHELCHVRRRDMLYKLLMVFVLAFHWFNPIGRWVRDAVTEDCEMACDATVLRLCGTTAVRDYMESILLVAEHVRRERNLRRGQYDPAMQTAFFMAGDTTPSYLKRRYLHMKNTREKKNSGKLYTICAGVLALIVSANVVLLSSCSYVEAADAENAGAQNTDAAVTYTYDPVKTALHNHFSVPYDMELTEEQYAQITSIDVYLITGSGDEWTPSANVIHYDSTLHAAFFSINGENVELLVPVILTDEMYETAILPAVEASETEMDTKKFNAFFCLKDPADPELEPRAAAEMLALFPFTENGAYYVYDPFTTGREDDIIFRFLYEAELVNPEFLSETAIRAKIASIPALADVTLSVYVGDDTHDFADAEALFYPRSENNRAAYPQTTPDVNGSVPADEIAMEMDINGNGIIGE